MAEKLNLAQLPAELRQQHGIQVRYRRLYQLAVDGELPAIQHDHGRWYADRDDLPEIAKALAA